MKKLMYWAGSTALLLGILYFFPWKLTWNQARSVTVTGEASSQENNQVATYNAGVNSVGDNKEVAIKEVNDKVTALVESVKEFGIEERDIKTQNMNIYQTQESYYEGGSQKQRLGQWNVSNTVEIKLREVTRATELADLLSKSGANNVWGPNFTLDETSQADDALTGKAIENAREKAEIMAAASGARLGKVIQVSEGSTGGLLTPLYRMEGGGGGSGMPTEPGSTMVTKTVTVTFELR